ncbi:MAG TPA: ABC transporter ATP-binding protein [Casimicrobiaceae bacterium]|nr:ABC transporter ATP-binding protein [Casimicrobiaceae bacterium]
MLSVRNLSAGYGAAPALWDISLFVAAGELVCVVGPNGAGKTTLINTIAGLIPVRTGQLAIEKRDVTHMPPHRFCEAGIALVPEGRRLFVGMTVRENLELGSYVPRARAARADSLAKVCELFPVVRDVLDRTAGTLSGGQQQMVAIGRALMARPRLLLLDEPSLGLAPRIVLDLFDAIQKINAVGTAVLLVEQNVAMALKIARRAYVLDEGRVVAEGSPEVLADKPALRHAYLGIASSPTDDRGHG